MHGRPVRSGAALVLLLATFAVSCSGSPDESGSQEAKGRSDVAQTSPADPGTDRVAGAGDVQEPPAPRTPAPEKVRDAFATLQATLGDSCNTPGNCAYLLDRVHRELMELDEAMKADPKGPGHFPEPIDWIGELRTTLDGDTSFENLKAHQDLLFGTRDKINVWMQDHPDDYR